MLNISGLSKTYGNGVRALDNISLNINKGMFGLLGPNGAGKSSLMRTIATLQDADSGAILFNGVNVLQNKDKIRSLLGYLPQEFGLYATSTAEELLNHLALLKGVVDRRDRRQTVDRLLRMTNLEVHRKKKLGGFSGGMKQRFGIAQALIGQPEIVIVDEPTAGLDPDERERFHNLLSTIGENVTVVLSTHIVSDVSDLCADMAIVNNGKVLMQRAPRLAIHDIEGLVWKKLFAKSEVEEKAASYQVISSRRTHGQVMIRAFGATSPGPGFEPVTPELEDVYFATIRGFNISAQALS